MRAMVYFVPSSCVSYIQFSVSTLNYKLNYTQFTSLSVCSCEALIAPLRFVLALCLDLTCAVIINLSLVYRSTPH